MSLPNSVEELYQQYVNERQITYLSSAEFEKLLLIFPPLLITMADGFVDTTEMLHINRLIKEACSGAISADDLKQEFRYLLRNAPKWRPAFVAVLKKYIKQNHYETIVMHMMVAAAGVSTGSIKNNILYGTSNPLLKIPLNLLGGLISPDANKTFFAAEEKDAILELAKELEIIEHPEVQQLLSELNVS